MTSKLFVLALLAIHCCMVFFPAHTAASNNATLGTGDNMTTPETPHNMTTPETPHNMTTPETPHNMTSPVPSSNMTSPDPSSNMTSPDPSSNITPDSNATDIVTSPDPLKGSTVTDGGNENSTATALTYRGGSQTTFFLLGLTLLVALVFSNALKC